LNIFKKKKIKIIITHVAEVKGRFKKLLEGGVGVQQCRWRARSLWHELWIPVGIQ
jgi:hypothetical protein